MKNFNEQGRSMIEMLGVLAIIGVLSVGGIAGYSKAMNKYKINKTIDQVSMLVANIRTLFSTQGIYDGLDNKTAIQYGIVPNDMYKAEANGQYNENVEITNAFGGAVTIKASDLRNTGDKRAFTIRYEKLSTEACVTIVTGDWGSGQGSGLAAIGVDQTVSSGSGTSTGSVDGTLIGGSGGGGGDTNVATPGGTISLPVPVNEAMKWCSSSADNAVTWKYY